MTHRPEDLMAALVCRYWAGGVTQDVAAKLLGIRKQAFAELADGCLFVQLIENAAWRFYLARFNHTFPECDSRARKRITFDAWDRGGRMFTDAELLNPPHRKAGPAAEIGNDLQACPTKIEVGNRERPQASDPRALARDNGQQLSLWAA